MVSEEVSNLQKKAQDIRIAIINMLVRAKSGHTAGPLGMADVFSVLYFSVLNIDPKKPYASNRDYLFLSNGHICPVLYASLSLRGFFSHKELLSLRKLGSPLQGHPHRKALPGIENSGGPLGQGLSQSCGAALGLLRSGKKNRVYGVCGDGELDEGQCWEAAMFAAHHNLHNLTWIVDKNNIQIDGFTNDVMNHFDLGKKFSSFGWQVIRVSGHDIEHLLDAFKTAKDVKRPTVILAHTTPGKGVRAFENDYRWHGKAPNEQEAQQAIQELKKQ